MDTSQLDHTGLEHPGTDPIRVPSAVCQLEICKLHHRGYQ